MSHCCSLYCCQDIMPQTFLVLTLTFHRSREHSTCTMRCVLVIVDRSVTPRVSTHLQRSAGSVLLSLWSWPPVPRKAWTSSHLSDRSKWHRKAWWADVASGSLATCPNSELRWRTTASSTGPVTQFLCSAHGSMHLGYLAFHVKSFQPFYVGSQ